MKLLKLTNLLALGLALAFVATGCKKKNTGVTRLPDESSGIVGNGLNNGNALKPGEGVQMGGGELGGFDPDTMAQDRAALAMETLYFGYDSSSIRGSEQSKIAAVASALKADPSAKLLIEGNCDERGTEEYNRSLGERRALAAREALASAGVDAGRVATRSYGEDRPANPGHSESAWSKNRRDEFVLLHPR